MPTDNGHTRQVPTNNGHTRQVPTDDGYTRQVPTDNGHTRQVPTDDGHTRQVPTDDGHTRQVPTDNGHTRQIATLGKCPLTMATLLAPAQQAPTNNGNNDTVFQMSSTSWINYLPVNDWKKETEVSWKRRV